MSEAADRFVSTLKSNGYSVTAARRSVFNALLTEEPLTMAQLIGKTSRQTNRASVYRTLAIFEELGIVIRIQSGWKYRLELSEAYNTHHHHITCTQCGETTPIVEDEDVEHSINQLAESAGYKPSAHQLEIRGVCVNCIEITTPVISH